MKPNTLTYLILLVICFFQSCNNYEFPASQYPRIATLPVVDITEEGVTFQGDITDLAKGGIKDHGFVWGSFSDPSTQNEGRLSMGALSSLGQFKANLKSGMVKNRIYYVQAYVATDAYLVYGEPVPFTSQGSTLPVINNVLPAQATWGDTVVINGKYFSSVLEKNTVTFGALASKVLAATDSTIRCIVPNNIATKSIAINVSIVGFKSLPFNGFSLQSPSINNLSPSVATFDDIITITGTNFSREKARNIFKFNEHLAEVIEASKTTLKVKVPRTVRKKVDVISLTVNLQTTSLEGKFSIAAPVISSVSSEKVFIGDELVVTGTNFHPGGENIVLFNKILVPASSTKTTLTFSVPDGIVMNRLASIEVSVADQSAKIEKATEIQDAWINKGPISPAFTSPVSSDYTVGLAINNVGYLGIGTKGAFRKYNPTEQTWSIPAQFPGEERARRIAFSIGKSAYIGGGLNVETYEQVVDFWKYDSESNRWTRLSDMPAAIQELVVDPDNLDMNDVMETIDLSHGGFGYALQKDGTNDLWMYNPASDSWIKKSTFPNPINGLATGFVIGNTLIYSSYGGTTTKFNLNSNTWSTSHGGPEVNFERLKYSSFSVGGYGYIVTANNLLKFDPIADNWIDLPNDVIFTDNGLVTFVIGGKAYAYNYLFWEYDPNYQLK